MSRLIELQLREIEAKLYRRVLNARRSVGSKRYLTRVRNEAKVKAYQYAWDLIISVHTGGEE